MDDEEIFCRQGEQNQQARGHSLQYVAAHCEIIASRI